MKKELEFLIDLQKQMSYEDQYDHDCQKSPRFWVIRDYEWMVTEEGHHERVGIYFPESDSFYTIDEYIEDASMQDFFSKKELEQLKIFKRNHEYEELSAWVEEREMQPCLVVYQVEAPFIVPNTLFLTKKSAKEHLKNNKQNYHSNAHTYAMTASRSPEVEELLGILNNFDFRELKSKLEAKNSY